MGHYRPKQYPGKRQQPRNLWLLIVAVLVGAVVIGLTVWGLRGKAANKAVIEVTGSPSLRTDYRAVDLGEVPFDKPVEVTFKLMNVGDQVLEFTEEPYIDVVAGC